MAGEPELNFNETAFMEGMFRKAEKVALRVGEYTTNRAKKHAPVRKVFKGSTYSKSDSLFSRYASPAGVARRAINRRALAVGENGLAGRRVQGHANSLNPVFKIGKSRVMGDFRKVEWTTTMGTAMPGNTVMGHQTLAKVPYSMAQISKGRVVDKTVAGRKISADQMLSGRGRYEMRSGRAFNETTVTTVDKKTGVSTSETTTRIGGKLQSEIHAILPVREGDQVWVDVVSSVPYARFMEFGTTHNRPYPYLRPALHESRGRLRTLARREFRAAGS